MRKLRIAALAVTLVFGLSSFAAAVDAPRWVAALYVAAQNAVGLRWTPVPGATGYKVLRSTTSGSGYVEIADTPQPQHFDTTVEAGVSYFYVLQAVAGGEVSAVSEEKGLTIPGARKVESTPPVWKDVTLTQTTEFGKTTSKVGLFWSPGEGKAIAYNLYRTTTPGKDYEMLTSTSEMQYVDATVEVGKTYYYVLSALDETFQETAKSEERSMEVKEPEKKVVEKKVKKRVKIQFRRARLLHDFRQGSWGALRQPTGVVVNSRGEINIVDADKNKVFVFSENFEFLFAFGEGGFEPGQLRGAIDIAIDPEDRLYVNNNDQRIEIFSANGTPEASLKLKELMSDEEARAGGIACGPDYWYWTNEKQGEIVTMEYDRNTVVSRFGSMGNEPGQFRVAKKLDIRPEDNAFVIADTFNFRIQTLTPEGESIAMWGDYGNGVGQFNRVIDVCVNEENQILAVDFGSQTTQGFDKDGEFLYVLGTADGKQQIPMSGAAGLACVGKRVYIANRLLGSVMVWELTDEIGPPGK